MALETISEKKIALVGLGNHGYKILESLQSFCSNIITADPVAQEANYSALSEIPLSSFDVVILAVPDEFKVSLIEEALDYGKHILVEKPLVFNQDNVFRRLSQLADQQKVSLRVAYSLDFEPHIQALLTEYFGRIEEYGEIYSIDVCYCNGTSRDVVSSQWKDKNCGVLIDLGCHVINLVSNFFPDLELDNVSTFANSIETKSYDIATIVSQKAKTKINMDVSFLAWQNKFELNVYCAKGSLHASGLTKWGNAQVSIHKRVFPSGRPIVSSLEFESGVDVLAAQAKWFLEKSIFEVLLPRRIDYEMDNYFRKQIILESSRRGSLCKS